MSGAEKIEFPVKYTLKVIMEKNRPEQDDQNDMETIFIRLKIPYSQWGSRQSGKGRYISYSVVVHLDSKVMMDSLYQDIQTLPGIKYAL